MIIVPSWTPVLFHVFMGGHVRKFIPYEVNGPFKQGMMSLFRLAWSSKVQLPLLITIAFMAFDVRLQIEINIFWDQANHRRRDEERFELGPAILGAGQDEPIRAIQEFVLDREAFYADTSSATDSDDDDADDDDSTADEDNENGEGRRFDLII